MIKKKVLNKGRIRRIDGGFVSALHSDQLLLYFFLVLAADRYGLSFYNYDKICSLLEMNLDQYIEARCALIKQDLIDFDGTIFQVLKLPTKPKNAKRQLPSPLQQLTRNMLKEVGP